MKNKFLCLILIVTVLCSLFVITSSAQDDYVIEAGSYNWNDTVSGITPGFYSLPFTFSFSIPEYYSGTVTCSGINIRDNGIIEYYATSFDPSFSVETPAYLPVYVDNVWTEDGAGKSIYVTADTVVDFSFYSGFLSNTSRVSSPMLDPGYYRLVLPIYLTDPSWIGDGNTVWYNMRGRVITDNSNRAFTFYRLGFRYNSWETDADRDAGWVLDILINDEQHADLEIFQISYLTDNGVGQFYWAYNDLVLDSFVGLAIDGNYEVDNDFFGLFTELFEPYEYVYTGNPWYDIVDGVVDALKIDVFGSFSPWDILVTFIGISVFIWLLKLLAGG